MRRNTTKTLIHIFAGLSVASASTLIMAPASLGTLTIQQAVLGFGLACGLLLAAVVLGR